MVQYTKSATGGWVNADDVKDGVKVKLITECVKQESKFKDTEGNAKIENVAKVRFQGADESVNMRLNWTTIYGLIDAFGEDSKEWVGKVMTAQTREAMVGDTVRTIVYLIPEGFELAKNAEKKMEIRRISSKEVISEEKPEYPEMTEENDTAHF